MSETDTEWQYEPGEVLKKKPSRITTPDGEDIVGTGTEYKVKYRFTDADSGDRFYYFEYREGKSIKNRLAFAPMVERDWHRPEATT